MKKQLKSLKNLSNGDKFQALTKEQLRNVVGGYGEDGVKKSDKTLKSGCYSGSGSTGTCVTSCV